MFNQHLLTRRRILQSTLSGLTGVALSGACHSMQVGDRKRFLNDAAKSTNIVDRSSSSLKEKAAAKGLIYGADSYHKLGVDPDYASCFIRECSMLVDGGLKWYSPPKPLRPGPELFDFSSNDELAEFAKQHNLSLRGHTLVWHQSLPPWFSETVNNQNAEQFLIEHIQTVTKHHAGRMHSWDVVNEAVNPKDGRTDGLRRTPWLEFLGIDYINLAFQVAAETDPSPLLVYNDFDLEYDTDECESKRVAVLKLLESLKKRGTPVHALGIQSHLVASETRFSPRKLRRFLAEVASLDLKILITEMDVKDADLPSDNNVRDRIVAAAYEEYLDVVLDETAVIAVLTWGLSDRYTWLAEYAQREDGRAVRPLPIDFNMKRKLAWEAIARSFDNAPPRPSASAIFE